VKKVIAIIFLSAALGVAISAFLGSQRVGAQSANQAQDPLLNAIMQSARQEHSKDSQRYLEQAIELLNQGVGVNAKDAQGRTLLHWTVIGAMYAQDRKLVQGYTDLADQLISRGVAINLEDDFGYTALDFQEVSPNDDLLYLLLDNGARNGTGKDENEMLNQFIHRLSKAFSAEDLSDIRTEFNSDLPAGTEIHIRLGNKIGSHISRSGDPIEAVVIAPVTVGDRVVIPAGTKVQGTVILALKAYNDYRRAQLILDLSFLVHQNGDRTRIETRLVEVDNARETVQGGRIIGLAHPNSNKLTWGARLFSLANPILAYAYQAGAFAGDKEYKRDIIYEPGVEMRLFVITPAKLVKIGGNSWPVMTPLPQLMEVVRAQPFQTTAANGVPSDLTNLMLIGRREEIEAAFHEAGWDDPDKLGVKSGFKTFVAVLEGKGYKSGPVSLLLLDGQKPELAFQKQNDTFAKRHHIRIWKRPQNYQGQTVWVAAATHDIGIAVHREGTQWIHRIDPRVDRERNKVVNDLFFTNLVKEYALVDRPDAPRESMNATGDRMETDGKIAVLVFK
jgi:LssY-like putative type I secretion system component LssY